MGPTPTPTYDRPFLLAERALLASIVAIFLLGARRYAFLGDDCFISFRYARNLVEGHGLVFNPGERVEGYTNFLWVLLMAAAMELGLSPERVSKVLGVASGLGILWALARVTRSRTARFEPLAWTAPACLAVNRTFAGWSTGGLETQFFSLGLLLAALSFHAERSRGTAWPVGSSILFAAATLTRPEGAIFFAVAGAFFAFDVFARRGRSLASLVRFCLPYVLIVGVHVGWRWQYYGFLLPNTFYAKVSGLWIEQSAAYLALFVRDHELLLFVPLGVWAVLRSRDPAVSSFGAMLAAYVAYLVYVGGDRFEYRFMAPVLPFLYWILQEAIRGAAGRLASRGWSVGALRVAATAAAVVLLLGAARPSLVPFVPREGINSLESIARYAWTRSHEGRFLRSLVADGSLTGREVIGVSGAGAVPYYSGLPTLDLLGLNDVTVAHSELERRGVVGHEKMATEAYIRKRGVAICDAFNQLVFERPPNPRAPRRHVSACPEPVRCLAVDGRYLAFSTTLSGEEFSRTFARFEIVY